MFEKCPSTGGHECSGVFLGSRNVRQPGPALSFLDEVCECNLKLFNSRLRNDSNIDHEAWIKKTEKSAPAPAPQQAALPAKRPLQNAQFPPAKEPRLDPWVESFLF